MLTPLLQITLPEGDGNTPEEIADRHVAPIIFALQAMVNINLWHIRRALKKAAKGEGVPLPPLYASGVRYKEDPPGEENWRDIYGVLRNGTGDCLPLSTLFLRDDYEFVPLAALRPGTRIMGQDRWTMVQEVCKTGEKSLLAFKLSNGCTLRCSREHRLFRDVDGREEEIRAGEAKIGDDLVSGSSIPLSEVGRPWPESLASLSVAPGQAVRRDKQFARIRAISDGGTEMCGDLTTDTGRFWLPESDTVVHNCDQLCSWRTAELLAAGIQAEPVIKYQLVPREIMIQTGYPADMVPADGILMIHVCVRFPDGSIEDPSKNLGMGGSFTNGV